MVGMAKLAVKKELAPNPPQTYPVFAALVWGMPIYICDIPQRDLLTALITIGIVMWLFRHNRDTLQGSLQASMQYLYNDSEHFDTFRNWLWHNK